jgi:uncharacterized protein YaeQ
MATKATVYKAELEISDIDRGYYATHKLTLAQHPSENDRRLMVRIIAFSLFAHEQLEFGRGLSTEDDPDLWHRDLTGNVLHWIELGQPEETSIRKACGRSKHVTIVTYSGNSAEVWWSKVANALARCKNLTVVNLDSVEVEAAARLLQRTMQLQFMFQEGCGQWMSGENVASLRPQFLLGERLDLSGADA